MRNLHCAVFLANWVGVMAMVGKSILLNVETAWVVDLDCRLEGVFDLVGSRGPDATPKTTLVAPQ